MTDTGHGPPARVVRCPSCRAAVDAARQTTCPFCGADIGGGEAAAEPAVTEGEPQPTVTDEPEPVRPVQRPVPQPVVPPPAPPAPAAVPKPPAAQSPALGTRIIALVAGIGLLVGIGLLQRFAREPDRAEQTTRRSAPAPERDAGATTPVPVDEPSPVPAETPVAAPRAGAAVSTAARACARQTLGEVARQYGFERERVGRWFDRLDRYNDHRLRIDGDGTGHARRDAAIERSRRSRLGSLGVKRDAARSACDARLLV